MAALHTYSPRRLQTVSGPTADVFLLKALEFLPTLSPPAAVAPVVLFLRPYLSNWPGIVGSLLARAWIGAHTRHTSHSKPSSFPVNKFGVDLCRLLSCFGGLIFSPGSLVLVRVMKKTEKKPFVLTLPQIRSMCVCVCVVTPNQIPPSLPV